MKTRPSSNHRAKALAHKRPLTKLRVILGNYSLYEYKTVYDTATKGA
jgi:hypothetical protein